MRVASSPSKAKSLAKKRAHLLRRLCCRRRGHTHECRNARGFVARAGNFYGRWAYHLFESVNGGIFSRHEPIEHSHLAVAALYRRALGLDGHAPRARGVT